MILQAATLFADGHKANARVLAEVLCDRMATEGSDYSVEQAMVDIETKAGQIQAQRDSGFGT